MTSEPATPDSDAAGWAGNYFNYFTEIEEHFQRARGTGLFLLSPLDWALIETWRNGGVPLGAVLKGIDDAFEKWRSRKQKRRLVNSLAYCAQAVLEAAQRTPAREEQKSAAREAPFAAAELAGFLNKAASAIAAHAGETFQQIAHALEEHARNAEEHLGKLEELERRLTALEEKMVAAMRTQQSDEDLYSLRESLDRELKPYRGKMTSDQIAVLERRYLEAALLERAHLPRLSLFYLH